MRTITITKEVYTFAELSDSAKETARNNYREHNLDYNWWDFTYDDAKTIGAFYGLYASTKQTRGNNMRVYVEHLKRDTTSGEEDCITSELNDFAYWIYSRLESEYEYLQSDEVIDEALNEYEFTSEGELI